MERKLLKWVLVVIIVGYVLLAGLVLRGIIEGDGQKSNETKQEQDLKKQENDIQKRIDSNLDSVRNAIEFFGE